MDHHDERMDDVRDDQGGHATPGGAAAAGAVTGGVVGAMGAGPAGAAIGAAAGALAGMASERLMHADEEATPGVVDSFGGPIAGDTSSDDTRYTSADRMATVPGEAAITDTPAITPDMLRERPDRTDDSR